MGFDFSNIPFRRELNTSDLQRMNIPQRYWGVRFDDISNDSIRDTGKSVKDIVRTYIQKMEEMRREGAGFIFWGKNGTGKSSISVVLAKEFRRRGNTVLFMEASDLKRMVSEREHFDEDETYWDRSKSVDVLILDDFGKGVIDGKGFGSTLFDELIRARNSRKLVTIITSNPVVKEWKERFDLKDSTLHALKECMFPVEVVGCDKRVKPAEKLAAMMMAN
jgi:DNA replication protein DnaC